MIAMQTENATKTKTSINIQAYELYVGNCERHLYVLLLNKSVITPKVYGPLHFTADTRDSTQSFTFFPYTSPFCRVLWIYGKIYNRF